MFARRRSFDVKNAELQRRVSEAAVGLWSIWLPLIDQICKQRKYTLAFVLSIFKDHGAKIPAITVFLTATNEATCDRLQSTSVHETKLLSLILIDPVEIR